MRLQFALILLLSAGATLSNSSNSNSSLAQLEHSLIDKPECKELQSLCAHLKQTDNVSVLECVSTFSSSQLEAVPDKCQHALWVQQRTMQSEKWVTDQLIPKHCGAQKQQISSCGNAVSLWSCIHERAMRMEHSSECRTYILRSIATLFPDFDQLGDFLNVCGSQIEQLECGRLNLERRSMSQLETVQCLQETAADALDAKCKAELNTIEQQRKDLEFFEACGDDWRRLCGQVSKIKNTGFCCTLLFYFLKYICRYLKKCFNLYF